MEEAINKCLKEAKEMIFSLQTLRKGFKERLNLVRCQVRGYFKKFKTKDKAQ